MDWNPKARRRLEESPLSGIRTIQFPLTPALSLRERENQAPYCNNSERLGFSNALPAIPPLPEGEGRGEGERALEIADRGRFAIDARIIAVFVLLNLWKLEIRVTS